MENDQTVIDGRRGMLNSTGTPPDTGNQRSRFLFLGVFWGFWGAYAVACVAYYEERIVFDAATFLTGIIHKESFAISQGDRYASAALQVLPLFGVKLGTTLNATAILYSLNMWVYHAVVACFLVWGLKRRDLAWALLGVLLAHLTHSFVYPQSEPAQGVVPLFLLVALFERPFETGAARIACTFLAAVLASFMSLFLHPLMLAVSAFLCFYCLALNRRVNLPALVGYVCVAAGFIVTKALRVSTYDRDRIESLDLLQPFREFWSNAEYLVTAHFLVGIVLVYFAVNVIRQKHQVKSLAGLVGTLGYAYLCFTTVSTDNSWLYLWHTLLPIYALAFIPFFDATAECTTGKLAHLKPTLMIPALVYCVAGIGADLEFVDHRHRIVENILDVHPDPNARLFLVDGYATKGFEMELMSKKLADESQLMTAYQDRALTRVLMPARYAEGHQLLGWCCNERYFPIDEPISKSDFITLNTHKETLALVKHVREQVRLDWPTRPERFYDGTWQLPVRVENRSSEPLASRNEHGVPLTFGYRWRKPGEVAELRNVAILRVDVYDNAVQYIPIKYPPNVQSATLEVDLTLGEHWLNVRRATDGVLEDFETR